MINRKTRVSYDYNALPVSRCHTRGGESMRSLEVGGGIGEGVSAN